MISEVSKANTVESAEESKAKWKKVPQGLADRRSGRFSSSVLPAVSQSNVFGGRTQTDYLTTSSHCRPAKSGRLGSCCRRRLWRDRSVCVWWVWWWWWWWWCVCVCVWWVWWCVCVCVCVCDRSVCVWWVWWWCVCVCV